MVEKALAQDPKTPTVELFEKAIKIKKGIKKLKLNQFRGRYVLAVSRKLSGKKPGPKKGARRRSIRMKKRQPNTELLREVFEDKKVGINDALESAYQKAIGSDRISAIQGLLTSMDAIKERI
tara:strand:- start:2283 stop:2648 length:366 start_codon:yes stop_codon:yes gene_type:complete